MTNTQLLLKKIFSLPHWRQLLAAIVIFFLALLPRLGALDRYVTPDELHWVDRSIRFSQALSRGDLASTIQAGHPGVTTMWLGSLGLTAQQLFNPAAPVPSKLVEFDPQDAHAMRYLAQFLTPMRWPVILVTSLNLVLLLWLLSRVIDRRAAFLAAALVALDPFAVALGGILHVDSLLMTFSLASLAALGVGLNRPSPDASHLPLPAKERVRVEGWLITSGVLAGLAMLSKSPAIVLVPTAGLVITLDAFHKRNSIGSVIRSSLIWGLSAAFIFIALYPAMWAAPVQALQKLTETAEKHSETAHAVNFFFGQSERDPGAAFYPVVAAFRSTPVLWLGLIAALILIIRARTDRDRQLRGAMWPYWVFAILFMGVVTLAAKKLDRYVLPSLEALNVIGAIGLAYALDLIAKHSSTSPQRGSAPKAWSGIAIALALGMTAAQFLGVWPLTLRAYNLILGGYGGASRALPVGGGESGEVAAALNQSAFTTDVIAATDIVGLAPFTRGPLVPTTEAGLAQADYMLFNASDFQLTPEFAKPWTNGLTPILTLTVQSQPFAWLYENAWLKADRQRAQQRQSDDAVIVDEATAALSVPLDATTVVTTALTPDQAVAMLQTLAQSHRRVLAYHFSSQPDRNTLELFRALDTYAVNLDQWSSPLSRGGLYELPDAAAFNSPPQPLNGNVVFADRVHLLSIQAVLGHVQPGQAISFVSQWQATGADTQLSISLLDAVGHVWSTAGTNVPMAEQAGITRQRRFTLPVPLTIPPGEYQLVLNVIDTANGNLLHARATDAPAFERTDWPLGSITIDPIQSLIDPATRIPSIALNADLGGVIRALGSDRPPVPIISGDLWTLPMEWAALSDRLPTLDVQWNVVAADNTVAYSTTLALNPYSTERWRKGEVLQSKYDFRLPITLKAGAYRIEFQLIDRAQHQPIGPLATTLTSIKIASRPRIFQAPSMNQPSNYRFGELASLLGANIDRAGTMLTVTLYWQARAITSTNYTVVAQLLGADGQLIKQIDNWQIGSDAPTNTWATGQVIEDVYLFEAPPGSSQVRVGMYNAADGQPLPIYAEAGQRVPDDKVLAVTLK